MRIVCSSDIFKIATGFLILISLAFHCLLQFSIASYFLPQHDELCINKYTPEVNYEGIYLIKNKITQSDDLQDGPASLPVYVQETNFYYFKNGILWSSFIVESSSKLYLIDQENWYSGYIKSILNLPELYGIPSFLAGNFTKNLKLVL
jgi:hypothetical protein